MVGSFSAVHRDPRRRRLKSGSQLEREHRHISIVMFENLYERRIITVKSEEECPSEPDASQTTGIRAVLTDPYMNCRPVRCVFDGDSLISGTDEIWHPDLLGPREQRAELSLLS